jgi:Big-like domain-containing protein
LPAGADIIVACQAGVRDFAGNPLAPFAIHFHTLPDAYSRAPLVASVSPADGAVNVPVNQPVEIRFTQAVDSGSVQSSLHLTEAGAAVTGAITADATGQVFDFQPVAPYRPGDVVAVDLENSVYTTAGMRVDPGWHGSFRPASPAGSPANAVAFSASARAIDVRFDGPAGAQACSGYLHRGGTRVPAACTATTADQIRVTPVAPLAAGADYRLVVDAAQEIAFRVEAPGGGEESPMDSVRFDASGDIMVRFRGRVNPLTVSSGLRLTDAAGECVRFTTQWSLDGSAIRIVPERQAAGITVTIDTVESRAGARLAPGRFAKR